MASFLEERLRRNPLKSQREAIALACRQSIATLGPMPRELVASAVLGLVSGLFGDAYDVATNEQRSMWLAVCDEEYRRAVGMPDDELV